MLVGKADLAEAMRLGYARGGYKGALKAQLKHIQRRRAAGGYIDPSKEASIQAQLGNTDLALRALEKAFAEGEDLVYLNVEPDWDPIRADPRFQDLVRRVGLPVTTGAGILPH